MRTSSTRLVREGKRTITFTGTYYDGEVSTPHPVKVSASADGLHVEFLSEAAACSAMEIERHNVRFSPRLGNSRRSLHLEDGSKIETDANDEVDAAVRALGLSGFEIHRLESSLRMVVSGIVLLVGMIVGMYLWGIPYLAKRAAFAVDEEWAYALGEQTLSTLDDLLFEPSQLDAGRQDELARGFAEMAKTYPTLPLHLEFRMAGIANAFALPDGTIVVTDELVELLPSNDQIFAVLAHEIGHVDGRHALRMTLETSAIGLIAMVTLGDASQATTLATSVPTMVTHAQFSQAHETEADTFALEHLQKAGKDPRDFARALEKLTEAVGAESAESLQYISSHPATKERMARFEQAR